MSIREGKYSRYAGDAHLTRWLSNLARGSPITAEVALRRLGRLSELLSLSPGEMVGQAVVVCVAEIRIDKSGENNVFQT